MIKTKTPSVRIISGKFRSRRVYLQLSDASANKQNDTETLRPTADRVRETVFNWLHFLLDGQWHTVNSLDCFAGSACLSFETISRGAKCATCVEVNNNHYRCIIENKNKLDIDDQQMQVYHQNFLNWVAVHQYQKFNLVFLDPPYGQYKLDTLLHSIVPLIHQDTLVYLEQSIAHKSEIDAQWEVVRQMKTSQSLVMLLKYKPLVSAENKS